MDARSPRALAHYGLIAALYVVTTVALSPLSFGPLQFRLSGMLQPLGLKGRGYALAIAIGTLIANCFSPFGHIDWVLMPVVSFASAEVARRAFGDTWMGSVVFSLGISLGVSVVLLVGAGLPYLLGILYTFPPILITNLVGRELIDSSCSFPEMRPRAS